MPQTEEMERLFVHPFTPKPKDGRPVAQNARTPPGHERFAFDDPRRLGTTRRATRACHDMHYQLKSGDSLLTLKHKNWQSSPSDASQAV